MKLIPHLLISFFITVSTTCVQYECASLSNACASSSGNTIYYDSSFCLFGTYCIIESSGYPYCQTTAIETDRLPGRKCTSNFECYSQLCSNNICVGNYLGTTCKTTLDCDVGLYCNGVTCIALKLAGQPCIHDSDCTYYYACNFGICVEYFSLPNGEALSELCDPFGISLLCASGQCYLSSTTAYYCGGALQYYTGDFIQCFTSADCSVLAGGEKYEASCMCGWNPMGTSYCNILVGSSYGKAFMNLLKNAYGSNMASYCHRDENYLNIVKDYGSVAQYNQLVYGMLWFFYGAEMNGAFNCILQFQFGSLYSAYNAYAFGGKLGIGFLGLVLAFS